MANRKREIEPAVSAILDRARDRWTAAMKEQGASLMQVAANAGLSYVAIYNISCGNYKDMHVTTLVKLARALNLEPYELLQ